MEAKLRKLLVDLGRDQKILGIQVFALAKILLLYSCFSHYYEKNKACLFENLIILVLSLNYVALTFREKEK